MRLGLEALFCSPANGDRHSSLWPLTGRALWERAGAGRDVGRALRWPQARTARPSWLSPVGRDAAEAAVAAVASAASCPSVLLPTGHFLPGY